jgi:dCTP deaminase
MHSYTELQPGEFILCRSVETFTIPEDVLGIVVGKSTYARCGLIVNCTPMEPGWTGQLTIELHNASRHAIKVYANEGIAQVMFFRGERPAITYADKRGKYQGQSGVTLPRVTQ